MYIELKIIKAINYLYRKCISIGLYSINKRDVKALSNLDKDMNKAEHMREVAKRLKKSASNKEDNANERYSVEAKQINTAYTVLQNAMDDTQLHLGE